MVFQGTCARGCSTGATTLAVNVTQGSGTQGEGRYLIDINPAKVITRARSSAACRAGDSRRRPLPAPAFRSARFLKRAGDPPSQAGNIAPGTVTVPIVTTGVPSGFATNTAALAATTGVACITDATNDPAAL